MGYSKHESSIRQVNVPECGAHAAAKMPIWARTNRLNETHIEARIRDLTTASSRAKQNKSGRAASMECDRDTWRISSDGGVRSGVYATYIAWVILGAFFTRGRPRFAALHVAPLVYRVIVEIFDFLVPAHRA